jgi:hypothetical protein
MTKIKATRTFIDTDEQGLTEYNITNWPDYVEYLRTNGATELPEEPYPISISESTQAQAGGQRQADYLARTAFNIREDEDWEVTDA